MTVFQCPYCHSALSAGTLRPGMAMKCPKCSGQFVYQDAASAAGGSAAFSPESSTNWLRDTFCNRGILMLIGLDMLQAKRSATQEVAGDTVAAAQKEDAGIVPLGIPMLAGPGAITSVMVLVGQAQTRWQMAAILISIAITAMVCYLVLGHSDRVVRLLGDSGIRILVRVMGLLLVALAAQYFVNGLADLGVLPHPAE